MNEQKQFIALAELDGYRSFSHDHKSGIKYGLDIRSQSNYERLPDYFSYNVIIPMIQRQPQDVIFRIIEYVVDVMKIDFLIKATPIQLGQALLHARGKWN